MLRARSARGRERAEGDHLVPSDQLVLGCGRPSALCSRMPLNSSVDPTTASQSGQTFATGRRSIPAAAMAAEKIVDPDELERIDGGATEPVPRSLAILRE